MLSDDYRMTPSRDIKTSQILLMSLFTGLLSCVGDVAPPKLDAYIGGGGGETAIPDLQPIPESRFLTFESRSGTMSLSLGNQSVTVLCEASLGLLSADSERILCIPESASSPLRFLDRLSGSIMELADWSTEALAEPKLALDGSVFVSLIEVPDQLDHAAVFNDFGLEIARMKTTRIIGFVGPEHLVVHNPPQIWSFADPLGQGVTTIPEAEEVGLASPIGSRDFIRHDYPPYGVVYSDREDIYFFGVDASASIKLGEGDLIGVSERRALTISSDDSLNKRLNVYDLSADPGSSALFSVPLTDISYRGSFRGALVGRSYALLQRINNRTCGSDDVEYAIESYLIKLKSGDVVKINDSGDPHHVSVSEGGTYALTRYLDNCGRGMGNADLVKLSDGARRELPAEVRGKVKGAAASARGGYFAVTGENQVWLLDGDTLELRVAHSGEPIFGGVRFTQ